jgi:hypothetical protein
MVRDLLVLGSICQPSFARSESTTPGGVAFAEQFERNRGAKILPMGRAAYPAENRWFARLSAAIHGLMRIGGVQFDAHLRNTFP